MSEQKPSKVNTVLLSVLLGLAAFGGEELYREMRSTHDAVLKYDVQFTDLKTRVLTLEVEFQKFKEKHP